LLISAERTEIKKLQAYGVTIRNKNVYFVFCLVYGQHQSLASKRRISWEAINFFLCRPLNDKENIFLLCALCVSSEAGGEIKILADTCWGKLSTLF